MAVDSPLHAANAKFHPCVNTVYMNDRNKVTSIILMIVVKNAFEFQ